MTARIPGPGVATRLTDTNREQRATVGFQFDGLDLDGLDGEPVAVALLAAGIRVFRTMPDSGESRGGFCFTGRCPDCLMVIDGISGVRACITPLREGMSVKTQIGLGKSALEAGE